MFRIPALLTLVLLLPAPPGALAAGAPSELVWQDRFAVGEHLDVLRDIVVSDGYVVVDGLSWLQRTTQAGKRERATHVSAYDLASGRLVWRQQFRAKGGDQLLIEDGTVLLTRATRFRVWAFDLATGEALWTSTEREVEAGLHDSALVNGILYTAGYWRPGAAPEFAVLVQARDPRTGTLLWEDRRAPEPASRVIQISGLAVLDGRFALLSVDYAGQSPATATIAVYDARTGDRLWVRPLDVDELWPLNGSTALCRGRLFITGTRPDQSSLVVRALAARTGKALWERSFTEQRKTGYSPRGLRCDGRNAYVAALSDDANDQEDPRLFLWALGRRRGAVRWQDDFRGEEIYGGLLQLEGTSILLRVQDQLRVYSRRGRLRWQQNPHPEGGWSSVDLTPDGRLAVAGSIFSEATHFDAVVRVLE